MKKLLPLLVMFAAGMTTQAQTPPAFKGRIERLDPAFDRLVAADAAIEKIAEGFTWAEGPL